MEERSSTKFICQPFDIVGVCLRADHATLGTRQLDVQCGCEEKRGSPLNETSSGFNGSLDLDHSSQKRSTRTLENLLTLFFVRGVLMTVAEDISI